MQSRFGMQRTLDGGMQATIDPIVLANLARQKQQEDMQARQQREQARLDIANQPGQQTLKSCDCGHCVGVIDAFDFLEKKLCPEGKAAAKRKFKVYPSAYANGWAVQYCKGKFRGKKKK